MSGEFINIPDETPENHQCHPPALIKGSKEPPRNTLWRCDCGKYYQYGIYWRKLSRRAARRELRKVGLAYLESPNEIIKDLEKDIKWKR